MSNERGTSVHKHQGRTSLENSLMGIDLLRCRAKMGHLKTMKTFAQKQSRPESSLDWRMCPKFARQRLAGSTAEAHLLVCKQPLHAATTPCYSRGIDAPSLLQTARTRPVAGGPSLQTFGCASRVTRGVDSTHKPSDTDLRVPAPGA